MLLFLSPRWIAGHLLATAGVVAFVSLGFWQLERLEERRTFNGAVEVALDAPAVDLDAALTQGLEYRRVRVAGVFDPAHEVLVLRSRDGTSGHHVATPLILEDGRGILVDRGWVPISFDTTPVADAAPPEGVVEIEGLLWPASAGAVPSELPTVARRIDPAIVDPFIAGDLVLETYVMLESPAPDGFPLPPSAPDLSEGSHLSYAVQWFLFATVVAVGYPILLRRVGRRQSPSTASSRSKMTADRET